MVDPLAEYRMYPVRLLKPHQIGSIENPLEEIRVAFEDPTGGQYE